MPTALRTVDYRGYLLEECQHDFEGGTKTFWRISKDGVIQPQQGKSEADAKRKVDRLLNGTNGG